jgi:DNA-binding response OmpR family regulator
VALERHAAVGEFDILKKPYRQAELTAKLRTILAQDGTARAGGAGRLDAH